MKKLVLTALLLVSLSLTGFANLVDSFANNDNWNTGGYIGSRDWQNHTTGGGSSMSLENWDTDDQTQNATWGYAYQDDLAITGGATYDISLWCYQDAGFGDNGSAPYIEISWADGDGNYYDTWKNWGIDNTTPEAWNETVFQAVAPASATQAKVVLGFEGATTEGGKTAYFDDLSMTQAVPEPVSAALLGIGIGFIYLLRKKVAK